MPHHDFTLEPDDLERLANLCGPFDAHLRLIELRLGVEIANRGNVFRVSGEDPALTQAQRLLQALYVDAEHDVLDEHAIHLRLGACNGDVPAPVASHDGVPQDIAIRVKRGTLRGRGDNQRKYLHAIASH
ncbi:MAG: hypothetical protein RLY77_926, partial [Pseudomonadota bacterium]